jgi:hypothetical protein
MFTDPRHLAATDDPETSHTAARRVVDAGTMADHEGRILAVLRASRGAMTYGELAAASGLEAPAVARRLKAMGVRGLIMMVAVRPCSVRTTMCQAWRAR